jgi:UDP-glucose 4-epimerase
MTHSTLKTQNPNLILVIGGAGYIGSHIVADLLAEGHDITVFDNLSTGFKENIPRGVNFYHGDILNKGDLKGVFQQPFDCVMHFAALKAAGDSMLNPSKYAEHNISGSINILDAMLAANVKNIIFSSSAAVYGAPEYLPVDEKHPTHPENFYGYTKLAIEDILNWYAKLKNINFAALRYFNAAGYDALGRVSQLERNPANLLPIVMEIASGMRKKMQIFGDDYDTHDGTGVRDYIHVNDLATAHIKAMNFIMENNQSLTVNLATGEGFSVLDVIKAVEKITGQKINYEIVARRLGDPAELIAQALRADDILKWKAKHSSLENILETMWRVYRIHRQN